MLIRDYKFFQSDVIRQCNIFLKERTYFIPLLCLPQHNKDLDWLNACWVDCASFAYIGRVFLKIMLAINKIISDKAMP